MGSSRKPKRILERTTPNGIVQNCGTQCRTKSGKTIEFLFSGELIEYRSLDCLLMVGQDISKMKELDRIKNKFISTTSHELRTPVTLISDSLGYVAGGVTGEIPDQANNLKDNAAKYGERRLMLVNNVLDMETIESGNMSYRSKPIELNELVTQTIEAIRLMPANTTLHLSNTDRRKTLWPAAIRTDWSKFRRTYCRMPRSLRQRNPKS